MSRLVLVRHAETTAQEQGLYIGTGDMDLTDHGRQQADLLGDWAKSASLDAIWSSPLTRALATVSPAAEVTGIRTRVDDRLRELHFGVAEGRTLEQLNDDFRAEVEAFRAAPVDNHLPKGEDPHQAALRVLEFLEEAGKQHAHGRVLVVFHNTVLRLALCHLLGIPLNEYRRRFPLVHNCALTEVQLKRGSAALLQYNNPLHVFERQL